MPLRMSLMERMVFVHSNLGPGPMADMFGGLAFKAVLAAVEIGVFEGLADGAATPAALADRIGASERGLRFLLAALEPLGYVRGHGDRYANSESTERWMLSQSDTDLSDLFRYFGDMSARWDNLASSVRKGEPAVPADSWFEEDPSRWDVYHAGMRAISRLLADEIVSAVKLPASARRLIDLGGSHGLHAVRFCSEHGSLEGTVLDWEFARESAEETIDAAGLAGRVHFRAGDIVEDDLGDGWDVALLFNVVRGWPEDKAREVFAKVHASLAAGGRLVIMDQLVEKLSSDFTRANARLIDLELFNTSPGDVYRAETLCAWLDAAGFIRTQVTSLRRSNGQGLIVAHKA